VLIDAEHARTPRAGALRRKPAETILEPALDGGAADAPPPRQPAAADAVPVILEDLGRSASLARCQGRMPSKRSRKPRRQRLQSHLPASSTTPSLVRSMEVILYPGSPTIASVSIKTFLPSCVLSAQEHGLRPSLIKSPIELKRLLTALIKS
jgi:hypothetical protein